MENKSTIFYPQDEMNTVLIPVTIGCLYNKCIYCSMYKDVEYREVELNEIEMNLKHGYYYTEKVFLTGADPLGIGFEKMIKLLELIKTYYPVCGRVASYASVRSISKYTVEELSILHNLGLRLLYIGFETGRDDILKFVKKGHNREEAIKQAMKLNEANLIFDTIIMYGIGGEGKSIINAIDTANMINQFTTNRILTMNLQVFNGTELDLMIKREEFELADTKERLLEIRTLLEHLEPKKPTIFDTTHPTNIINIKGTISEDKLNLLNIVNRKIATIM